MFWISLALAAPPLTWLDDSPVTRVDPLYALTAAEQRAATLVYDRLLVRSALDGAWTSRVLEDWQALPDGRLALRLKKGLRWHDNRPVTVEDVCFSVAVVQEAVTTAELARLARAVPATCAPVTGQAGVVRVTVRDREADPWARLSLPLLPHHAFPDPGILPGEISAPVGTGPYRVEPGDLGLVYVAMDKDAAVPALRQAWAWLDTARTEALVRQGASALAEVPPAGLPAVRQAGFDLKWYPTRRWTGALLRTGAGPLASVEARRALLLATDRQGLLEAHGGLDPERDTQPCRLVTSPFHPDDPRINRGVTLPARDPEAARALIPGGLRLRLGTSPTRPDGLLLAHDLAGQWKDAGIEVDIVVLDERSWVDEVLDGALADQLDVVLGDWDTDFPVDAWLRSRDAGRGVLNPFVRSDPALDAALDVYQQASDPLGGARSLHANLADLAALLPLFQCDAWSAWPAGAFVNQPLSEGTLFGAVDQWRPPER
jgi:ABC-type transport system substrate-binding protein